MLGRDEVQKLYSVCSKEQREEVRLLLAALERGDIGLHEVVTTVTTLYDVLVGTKGKELGPLEPGATFDVDTTVVADFAPQPVAAFVPVPESPFAMPDKARRKLEDREEQTARRYPT